MHFVYIDDSKGDRSACFSCLIIPAEQWRAALDHIIDFRRDINSRYGVYIKKEIHATDWLAGRGRVGPRVVSKALRAVIFREFLETIATIPGAQSINGIAPLRSDYVLFERLMNRIQKNMEYQGSRALIFSDQGKSYDTLLRRMRHHNHIPSRLGMWKSGAASKNIPISRIVEDIVYRDSARSFLVQAADACAFSLLRKEFPTPKMITANIHTAFDLLDPILVKQASRYDPQGILRVS